MADKYNKPIKTLHWQMRWPILACPLVGNSGASIIKAFNDESEDLDTFFFNKFVSAMRCHSRVEPSEVMLFEPLLVQIA